MSVEWLTFSHPSLRKNLSKCSSNPVTFINKCCFTYCTFSTYGFDYFYQQCFFLVTYWLAADVIMGVVMVVGVVEDGGMLINMAQCVAVVAVGQTVVTALLGCLVARWWERLRVAT